MVVTLVLDFSGVLAPYSHTVEKHGENMKDCVCTTQPWVGTETVWSYLEKKVKQVEKGDVILKSVAKLN